jgi:hypothetical protein
MKKAILISKREITRNDGSKAYPLNEIGMPIGDGSPNSLGKVIEFLNVEKSLRYKPNIVGGKMVATYCNIYAFDYCNLAGGYLPRVWWGKDFIKAVEDGLAIETKYGVTVFEQNANSLYDWFCNFANQFGWIKQNDLFEAQDLANKGYIVIVVAAQKISSRAGHITAIVPETETHKAKNVNKTFVPLQSQAGANNKSYFNDNWFTASHYRGWGVWAFKAH